jgi:hypothetical protein
MIATDLPGNPPAAAHQPPPPARSCPARRLSTGRPQPEPTSSPPSRTNTPWLSQTKPRPSRHDQQVTAPPGSATTLERCCVTGR